MTNINYEIVKTNNPLGIDNCIIGIKRSYENIQTADLHWHDALELNLMLEGAIDCYTEGKHYVAQTGDLILVNKNCIHILHNPIPKTYATALIMVIPNDFLLHYVPSVSDPYFKLEKDTPQYAVISTCMEQITQLIQTPEPPRFSELLIHQNIISIIYQLYSHCLSEKTYSDRQLLLARQVIEYVSSHYKENLSISAVANKFGLQENYFCRCFKNQAGMSFHQYLCRIRLDIALALLSNNHGSLLSCALDAGFASEQVFIDWCKKTYNCTPIQYKLAKNNNS